jgi:3-deoxy-manno-octulosonate cytidylyltransferase (CMP-KDO synthetase)
MSAVRKAARLEAAARYPLLRDARNSAITLTHCYLMLSRDFSKHVKGLGNLTLFGVGMPTIRAPLRPLVLVPARLGATRLPDKPLADIHGEPMIVHVWRRASEAGVGPVVVATDSERVVEAVTAAGGQAVMTRPDHPSGSDRIREALTALDPDRDFNVVLNVQGDLPTIDPAAIRAGLKPLDEPEVAIATLAAEITREEEKAAPSVVKMIGSEIAPGRFRCLYFTRATAPTGPGPLYHHIGLYAYRRDALERFVSLPPSPLELREKLEQLRALEAGMRIDAVTVDVTPLGVDTPDDLERARALLAPGGGAS